FADGKMKFRHKDYSCVRAVPYHVPVVGFAGKTVNHLKLWRATPLHDRVDMDAFNRGDYCGAMKEKNDIEAISCILYPDDSQGVGRLLRLKQEYFFVAAGVGDICRRYVSNYGHSQWDKLPERVSIHINDTHPTLCIPELMRILLDEEKLEWDEAWEITKKTISFTNHTVLPEALEKWPIDMFKDLLPRIYMIVEEINRRWNEQVTAQAENAFEILKKTAVLYDNEVRMANLSIIGSHSVNGVAALHTEILKTSVFEEFHKMNPEKFFNMTNGVSHRRFMIQSNLNLADLILDTIGDRWLKDLNELKRLEEFKNDSAFMEQLMKVKRNNKIALGEYIYRHNGIKVDPDSVFDIQVKRMHAYKRQLLNAFKVLDLYNQIKSGQTMDINPYTFVFSGKAAQGYAFAKETIKFINSIADLVNNDPEVSRLIKVVFIENFCVTNG
ncbi:MAG: glycogen/starch/alpha-glucan family phosphorylase, partial [Parasporobacterium sp.]|nr:glycogen/starch/alpha-glucan family phosphorylase [Parasporobacterium sp.]